MRRGTTPTHSFSTDIDLSEAEVLYITYRQKGTTVVEKTIDDVDVTEDKIEVTLSQEDTLAFAPGTLEMQIRARFSDGSAFVSNIMQTSAERLLKGGVI